MDKTGATAESIEAFSKFLTYGPIGLVGLLMVVVVLVLVIGSVTPARERLLKHLMYITAGCFLIALVAPLFKNAAELYVDVLPLNSEAFKEFPPPIIKANKRVLKTDTPYSVSGTVNLSVDVSAALNLNIRYRSTAIRQQDVAFQILKTVEGLPKEFGAVVGALQACNPSSAPGVDFKNALMTAQFTAKAIDRVSFLAKDASLLPKPD